MRTIVLKLSSKALILSTVAFIGLQCTQKEAIETDNTNTVTEPANQLNADNDPGSVSKYSRNEENLDKDNDTNDKTNTDTDTTTDTDSDTDTTEINITHKDPIFKYTEFTNDPNAHETLIITVHGLNMGSPEKDFKHIIKNFEKLGYTCFNTVSRSGGTKIADMPDTHTISIDEQAEMLYKEILDLNNKHESIKNWSTLKRVCIVGHSLGGVVAARTLKKYGHNIEKTLNCNLIGTTLSSPLKGVEYNNSSIEELIKTEENKDVREIIIPILSPKHSNLNGITNLKKESLKEDNNPSKYPMLYITNSCAPENGSSLLSAMGIKQPEKNINLFKALHNNEPNDGLIPESSMALDIDTCSSNSKSQQYKMKYNCSHSDILKTTHTSEVTETISMFIQMQNKTL